MFNKKASVSIRALSFAENVAKHSQTRCKQLFVIFQLNLGDRDMTYNFYMIKYCLNSNHKS